MRASTYFSILALLLAACAEEPPAPAPAAVRTAEVRVEPVREGLAYLGDVESTRTVRVLARLQGVVSALPVDEGAEASAGTELVRMATPDVAARLQRVRAERQRAETERDHACKRLETDERLGAEGDLPGDKVDMSVKACTAATHAAEAALAAEREAMAVSVRSAERAPFDGEVLDQLVDVGQIVMPGTPLLVYGSGSRELRVSVSERDLASVAVGTPVQIELPDGRSERSEVSAVGARAVGPGRTVEVRVPLDEADEVRVGQRLDLLFVTKESEDTSAVPEHALFHEGDVSWVYLVVGDKLQRVDVEPGARHEGWVAVQPALPGGTLVALGPVPEHAADGTVLPVQVRP